MVMSAFSTMLPQLETAAYQLQLFSAFQAHAGSGSIGRLVSNWVSSEAEGVLANLSSVAGLVGETRLGWIRDGLQVADPTAAYGDLTDLLPGVLGRLEGLRTQYNEEAREHLTSLDRIVRGGRLDLTPLPSLSPLYPKVPAWAREVEVRVKKRRAREWVHLQNLSFEEGQEPPSFSPHLDLAVHAGSLWVQDLGGRFGTLDRTHGIRLRPGVWWPVTSGGPLRLGPRWLGQEISFHWTSPPLEELRWEIAKVNSLDDLKFLLRLRDDTRDLVGEVDRWAQGGHHLSTVPEGGGLRWKVVELLLRQEFEPIRRRYLEAFREGTARSILDDLTRTVDAADSPAALAAALRGCLLPIGYTWAREVERFFAPGEGARSLDPFPEDFGIRRKVRLLWAGWEASVREAVRREVEEAQRGREAAEVEIAEIREAARAEREAQRRRWEAAGAGRTRLAAELEGETRRAGRLSEALRTIQTVDLAEAIGRIGRLEEELRAARLEVEEGREARRTLGRELAAAKEGLLTAAVEGEEDRRISDTLEEGGGVPLLLGLHYVVGRGTGSHIIIGERNVSWRHFEIVGTPEGWRIRDLKTPYGTRVNDNWVRTGWHPLQNADKIRLGAEDEMVLVFTIVENGARAILTYPGKTPPPQPPPAKPRDIVLHPTTAPKGGGSSFSIGRGQECDARIGSNLISRVHLLATYDAGRGAWFIADAGSSNGSSLKGVRLEKNAWTYVVAGDRLRLGAVEFQVSFGPEGQLQLDRVDEVG